MATKNGNGVKNSSTEMGCYNCGHQCGGNCYGCGGLTHYLLRWALGIFIIIFTLMLGIQIGEFKGAYKSNYHFSRGMMGDYDQFYSRSNYSPMMDRLEATYEPLDNVAPADNIEAPEGLN